MKLQLNECSFLHKTDSYPTNVYPFGGRLTPFVRRISSHIASFVKSLDMYLTHSIFFFTAFSPEKSQMLYQNFNLSIIAKKITAMLKMKKFSCRVK